MTEIKKIKGKILDFEKYKIKKKMESYGIEWIEDPQGKIKIWIRLKNKRFKKL